MRKLIIMSILVIIICVVVFNKMLETKATQLPLVPPLTKQEVIDYYTKALEFDKIIAKKAARATYELAEVDESTKQKILKAQKIIEGELFKHDYVPGSALTKTQHHYIKAVIDDKQLIRQSVERIERSVDFYIIDVRYDYFPKTPGVILETAHNLGIHGAFKSGPAGDHLDQEYFRVANAKVWKYLNEIPKQSLIDLDKPITPIETPQQEETQDKAQQETAQQEETQDKAEQETTQQEVVQQVTPKSQKQTEGRKEFNRDFGLWKRTPLKNINIYNKIMGSSITNTAFMPELSLVFKPSGVAETMAGYGIYPEGNAGMKLFGFERYDMRGSAVLRYVFKSEVGRPSKLKAVAVYPLYITAKFEPKEKDLILPEFITQEIEKIIDRYDRALANNDITALMSGNITRDVGVAIRNGFFQNHVYLTRHISKVNKVLDRKGNYYLVEIETLTLECPKGTRLNAGYKIKSLVVAEQRGENFVINDILTLTKQLIEEPQLEHESFIKRRLAALDLQGEIDKKSKEEIKQLLNDLYEASTKRSLHAIYSCFNDNVELLPSSKKEYLNSRLRGWLIKEGIEVPATYKGVVKEWLGGSEVQAEFITVELIEYVERNKGQYMEMYYLVSNMDGRWVIDEIKPLEIKIVSGSELKNIKRKIKG